MACTSLFQIHRTGQTMGINLISFLLCSMVVGAAAASDVRYAIIQMDGAGHGYLVTNAPLAQDESVHIQSPSAYRGIECCKRLVAGDFTESPSEELLATDEVGGKQMLIYRVRVPRLWYEMPFIGIAAVGKVMKTRNAGFELELVNSSKGIRRAKLCTSQEGIHLIERVGASERTHLYLSLGYAIESPTCH